MFVSSVHSYYVEETYMPESFQPHLSLHIGFFIAENGGNKTNG